MSDSPEPRSPALRYDYAIVRVVPRVERGEFINVGVVLWCAPARLLTCRIELDRERLLALDPKVDMEMVESALDAYREACCGRAGAPLPELRRAFDFMVAVRSTVIQVSPAHAGLTHDVDALPEQLLQRFVRRPDLSS
jgi:hypothetical protein